MINKKLNLVEDVFCENIHQAPTRLGYGEGLVEAGKLDANVVALCADLTESTKTNLFAKEFPHRFVEMGIGEQSMASVASGMAAMGKIPFFASYAVFSPGRNWEQIRTTICYNNSNVKIVGAHAGVSVGPDGGTHQAIEDIAITRVIPRMTVLVPCDSEEAKKATLAAAKYKGPVYIRLARENTPVVTTDKTPFEIGKAYPMWKSDKPSAVIFTCGNILHNTLKAVKRLAEANIKVSVVNVPTIKPLDKDTVINFATQTDLVITIEEHQVAGGLGGTICELLSEHLPRKIIRIGIDDQFGESGTPEELLASHGLDEDGIYVKLKEIILFR